MHLINLFSVDIQSKSMLGLADHPFDIRHATRLLFILAFYFFWVQEHMARIRPLYTYFKLKQMSLMCVELTLGFRIHA